MWDFDLDKGYNLRTLTHNKLDYIHKELNLQVSITFSAIIGRQR